MESYNLTEAYLEIYDTQEIDEASLSKTIGNLAMRGAKRAVKAVRDYGTEYPIGSKRRAVSDTIDALHWASMSNAEREKRTNAKHRARNTRKGHDAIMARNRRRQEVSDRWHNRRTQQESREYLISYLLDEGYASDISSAESIYDSMSEGWKTDVLKSTLKTTGKVLKGGAKIMNKTGLGKKVRKFATRTALGAVGIPMISE